jgi:superfamily II DNA helicase RecQ
MNRVGLDQVLAIGGIEAGLKSDSWIMHAHVAVANASMIGIDNLRNHYTSKEAKRPIVVQKVRDVALQLSYIQKFHTYNRPTKSGKAYPLKPKAALELAQWLNRHEFQDLLFLKGLRRRGASLVQV